MARSGACAVGAVTAATALCDGPCRTGRHDRADDGDLPLRGGEATRLGYDQPGTSSLKSNPVRDRLLGLGLFPAQEMRRELAFHRSWMLPYGVPLNTRVPLSDLYSADAARKLHFQARSVLGGLFVAFLEPAAS